jgi:hypothetical protein
MRLASFDRGEQARDVELDAAIPVTVETAEGNLSALVSPTTADEGGRGELGLAGAKPANGGRDLCGGQRSYDGVEGVRQRGRPRCR